jgi:hypothetical protein
MPKAGSSTCSICSSCPHPQQPPPPLLAFGNADTALQRLKEHAQALFDAEREAVLSGLSDAYRGQWGRLFGHEDRLVFVKSPYDIPMGPERSMWMNKFSTVRLEQQNVLATRNDREKQVARVVGPWPLPFSSSLPFVSCLHSLALVHLLSCLSAFIYFLNVQLRKINRLDIMPHLVYDVRDKGFELVSPVDLEEEEEPDMSKEPSISADDMAATKRPVEAYDLLALEPSAINRELLDLPLGTRLTVFWAEENEWFEGTIDEHSGSITHVTYDDGDEHWIRLSDEQYQVLPAEDNGGAEGPAAGGAPEEEPEPPATHTNHPKKKTKKTNPKKKPVQKKQKRGGGNGNSGKSTSASTPRKRAVADRAYGPSTLEDTEDEDFRPAPAITATTTTTPKKKRKRSANDERVVPASQSAADGEPARPMPARKGSGNDDRLLHGASSSLDQSYLRPKKEPKRLRNGKFVATDPKPEGYEWCDNLGLWVVAEVASDRDGTAMASETGATTASLSEDNHDDGDDDESYEATTDDDDCHDGRRPDEKKADATGGVCLHSLAHALLEESKNHKMRIAYAKLGTMKHLGGGDDACPPVESNPSVKGKTTAAPAPAPAVKCDASEDDEGKAVVTTMDRRATPAAGPAVKCDESVDDGEAKVFVKMDLDRLAVSCLPVQSNPSVKFGSPAPAVKTDDAAAAQEDDEDEVKVVSVKKGSSPAVICEPIRSAARIGSGVPGTSSEAAQRIHRIKQALEWEIAFDDSVVDDVTLRRLRELLESLQSICVTVQLLHETNINGSLVRLKSELASRKSPATKPLLKLTKSILARWKEIYELHKHMNKELRPVVQSWREAVESGHAQGIGVELQHLMQLINARGLCRHVVRELGLEKLIDESRKVYARHNERPLDAFEDLHNRIRNAQDELQV